MFKQLFLCCRWLCYCNVPQFCDSLPRYETTQIFGRTLLRSVFTVMRKQLLEQARQEKDKLPPEKRTLILTHFPKYEKQTLRWHREKYTVRDSFRNISLLRYNRHAHSHCLTMAEATHACILYTLLKIVKLGCLVLFGSGSCPCWRRKCTAIVLLSGAKTS